MKLSAVIITKNEEEIIGQCLESLSFCDEIVLIDSQSTDRTKAIAEEYGARIFSPEWKGYGHAKQEGVKRAQGEWVLSIDADEVVTDDLAEEIRSIVYRSNGEQSDIHGYYINRCTNFLGRWIHHCGWYPDAVLRLFRKAYGQFDGAEVHEKVIVNGATDHLKSDLLHYSYPNIEKYFEKSARYTTMGAEIAFEKGKKPKWHQLVLRPPVSFVSHYLFRQGFRDGVEGFIISVLSAVAVFVKYTKLRYLYRTRKDKE